jgi:hypothetical protein
MSCQAYVRHPELAAARANRDFVLKQVCDAVNTISGVAQASGTSSAQPYESSGELAAALNDFDVCSHVFLIFIMFLKLHKHGILHNGSAFGDCLTANVCLLLKLFRYCHDGVLNRLDMSAD